MHAGKSLRRAKAEGALNLELQRLEAKWTFSSHAPTSVDPRELVLRLIAYWQWRLDQYGRMQAQAIAAAERLRQAHAAGDLLLVKEPAGDGEVEPPELQAARRDLEHVFVAGPVAAIVSHRYDVDRSGRVFPVEEGLRALEELIGQASDRLARLCKTAIDAGFEERRIELARLAGGMVATVISNVLARRGITPDQELVAEIDREMAQLAGVSAGG